MRYVRRDSQGRVDAHFAHPNAQAQELLPDDHPEILEFKARASDNRTLEQRLRDRLQKSVYARGMMRLMAKNMGISEEEVYKMVLELAGDK